MSKYDYLHALYQALFNLDNASRNIIMREIEDRFRQADDTDLHESTVIQELGTPQELASKRIALLIDHSDITPVIIDEGITESSISEVDLILVHNSTSLLTQNTQKKEEIISPPQNNLNPDSVQSKPSYLPHIKTQKNNTLLFIMSAILGLTLFNSIFILGPFIAVWGGILALVTAGVAITFSGLLIIISGIFTIPMSFISVPLVVMGHPVLLFAFGFLTLGIGGLLTVLMVYSIRFCGILTGKYIGWNIKVIRGY